MVEVTKTKFKLRTFQDCDAEAFVAGINSESIARDTTIELPWDVERAKWWIAFIQDAQNRQPLTEKHFVIEVEGTLAGSVALINIDGHKTEIGYWLIDEYAGQGIVSSAIAEVIKYARQELGIKRFLAPVLLHNKASVRVLEKNGFELEGVAKKLYLKNGKYLDAYQYALTE